MRTTVTIDDHLHAAAKTEAAKRGLTLGQYLEEAVRRDLSQEEQSETAPVIPVFSEGTGFRPGVDATSTRGLLTALDEDLPTESLR